MHCNLQIVTNRQHAFNTKISKGYQWFYYKQKEKEIRRKVENPYAQVVILSMYFFT